jgi:hypothetical protein
VRAGIAGVVARPGVGRSLGSAAARATAGAGGEPCGDGTRALSDLCAAWHHDAVTLFGARCINALLHHIQRATTTSHRERRRRRP